MGAPRSSHASILVLLAGLLGSSGACSDGGGRPAPDAGAAADAEVCPPRAAPSFPDAGLPEPPAPTGDILADLRAIPGMEVVESASPPPSGYRFFEITYEQPADHLNPGGPKFKQRIRLLHRSSTAPTVLATNGYFVPTSAGRFEVTQLLSANQVSVEHRFFVPSRPDPADWSKLDIWQAASDHHRIVRALKRIYPGRWIATGASKSGMTAVFDRRFYPDDVDGTVAYVAPLSLGAPDTRYIAYVDNDGPSADCRQKLRDFQRLALMRRPAMLARLSSTGQTFDVLGPDTALEHAVIELPFSLWQYSDASSCDRVPGAGATDDDVFAFLDDISDVGMYGDADVIAYGPYYYQAATQLGFPAINEQPVADLLLHPGTDTALTYSPRETNPVYDPCAMRDVDRWVRGSGRSLLFIYGEYDPWSAGAFELGDAQSSLKLMVPAGNHGSNINKLPEADRTRAINLIRGWLGLAPQSMPAAKPAADDAPLEEPRRRL